MECSDQVLELSKGGQGSAVEGDLASSDAGHPRGDCRVAYEGLSRAFRRSTTTMSGGTVSVRGSLSQELPGDGAVDGSAASVLRLLAPRHSATVEARLQREQVMTAADLADLEREDLRDLGLTMVERAKVLRWVRHTFQPVSDASKATHSRADCAAVFSPSELSSLPGLQRQRQSSGPCDGLTELLIAPGNSAGEDQSQHLEDVESRADFWCRLVIDSGPTPSLCSDLEQVDELLRRGGEEHLGDLRENVLEKLFDLSPERLKEVYQSIDRDSDGRILKEELREGLHRCELHGLDGAVEKVLRVVCRDTGSMRLDEFESVLTRLKLAQLLSMPKYQQQSLAAYLTIIDYSSYKVEERKMRLRDFFFGHRHQELPMRWVHLQQFDLSLLLAITVKYQLHPLSVEDVIDQAPTKIDRYDGHYFLSIEHLALTSKINGLEPVKVRGRHVTVFCAGAPHWDTVITVSQGDRSFQQDWPGKVPVESLGTPADVWVGRLHKRLRAVRSRVRERRADFLMYVILDLCTDDIGLVTRVYTARLNFLEEKLQKSKIGSEEGKLEWFNEIGIMRLQLAVVSRRLRGLQRILRRLADDPDLNQVLSSYLGDVREHINEAYEDAGHLGDKCWTLSAAYEHAEDRAQDRAQRQTAQAQNTQDERMNKMLFILTILTTIFTPLTFLTGVYGMNFQHKSGVPTIPELLQPDAYYYFLVFTLVYLVVSCFIGIWLWRRVMQSITKGRQSGSSAVQPNVLSAAGYATLPTLP